jgi:chromosome segregation ATPase
MGTESADGTDVSVTVPRDLQEWLDERAATLDVDRGELLVQLASAYRAAADVEGEPLTELLAAEIDGATREEIAANLAERDAELDDLADRIEDVESDLSGDVERLEETLEENVEDLRNRVLQLRDTVRDRAAQDHTHREFARFDSRVDELTEAIGTVATDVEDVASRVDEIDDRVGTTDEKLLRLARAVVAIRREADVAPEPSGLEEIRRTANREGVVEADCGACRERVAIGLLSEPTCPHCDADFEALDAPAAGLARRLGFRTAELRCADQPALEGDHD